MASFLTVRPASAPYVTTSLDLTGLGGDSDTSGAAAPTFGGGGSWADDSDATFADMPITPAAQTSAVVAADFAPIPNIAPATNPPRFGMMMRVTVTAEDPTDMDRTPVTPLGMYSRAGSLWVSLLRPFPPGVVIPTPTTYTSTNTSYTLFDGLEQVRTEGFTIAVAMQWREPMSGTVDLTVFELAVTFEVVDVTVEESYRSPSLRQLHRGGRGGIGGIPRAVGDRTFQGSLRRGSSFVR